MSTGGPDEASGRRPSFLNAGGYGPRLREDDVVPFSRLNPMLMPP